MTPKDSLPDCSAGERRTGARQSVELLPRKELLPDTRHRFLVDAEDVVEQARLDIYSDGGLARLRMFGELA